MTYGAIDMSNVRASNEQGTYIRLEVRNLLERRVGIPARLHAHLRQVHSAEGVEPGVRRHNVHTCRQEVEDLLDDEDLIGGEVWRQLDDQIQAHFQKFGLLLPADLDATTRANGSPAFHKLSWKLLQRSARRNGVFKMATHETINETTFTTETLTWVGGQTPNPVSEFEGQPLFWLG